MDVQPVPENQEAVVPGVREEVALTPRQVNQYGRYRGDLNDQGDGEPDLHFCCRWVLERTFHPNEPPKLKGLRDILEKTPERFYAIFQKEKDRFEVILDRQDELDAQRAAEEKAAAKEVDAPADAGTAKCLELLDKLIGELTAQKQPPPRK